MHFVSNTPTKIKHGFAGKRGERTMRAVHARNVAAFAGVIVLALAVQLWAIFQWPANFDSDEATFGLMALHMMQGRIPVYMYGQNYLSVIEPGLSAVLMQLFGVNVVVFRLSTWVLWGLFLVLHGILVARVWNTRVALMSLLVLAVPGPHMLWWTYRPIAAFGTLLVCGTGALLLLTLSPQRRVWQGARLFVLGMLFGLGIWTHTMMVIYIATIAGVAWLRMSEWQALHRRFTAICDRIIHISARELLLLAMFGFATLGTLAFFSNGCEPIAAFATTQRVARLVLLAIGVGVSGGLVWLSTRRRILLNGALILAGGILLGNLPQWYTWLFNGIAPTAPVWPSCPTASVGRAGLMFGELVPAVWGLPSLASLVRPTSAPVFVWIVLAVLVIVAGIRFVWNDRTSLWALLTATPFRRSDVPGVGVALLFSLPIVLAALSSNTIDMLGVRYLLITWQAASVIFALLLAWAVQRLGRAALVGLMLFGLVVGGLHLRDARNSWPAARYNPQNVAALEQYLQQQGVRVGYADYWLSYTLDFLTQERLVIAPYNGVDRYPPYTEQVGRAPVRAFIFWHADLPPELRAGTDFAALLQHSQAQGLAVFPYVAAQTAQHTVLERQSVGGWDVWIVTTPSSSTTQRAWLKV